MKFFKKPLLSVLAVVSIFFLSSCIVVDRDHPHHRSHHERHGREVHEVIIK
jgi:hypothetical protein